MNLWDLIAKPLAQALAAIRGEDATTALNQRRAEREAERHVKPKGNGGSRKPRMQRRAKPAQGGGIAIEEGSLFAPPKPKRIAPAKQHDEPKLTLPAKGIKANGVNSVRKRKRSGGASGSMQDRYEEVVRLMLAKHGVRLRKWRTSMSGIAYLIQYRDGTQARLIESPRPKSPLSMAIFLHEIGHHAIGLGIYKPRCLEEYLAWKFSLEQMEELGLPVTDKVHNRVKRSLEYAVAKARRRGIKEIPAELAAYDTGRH